jgi:pimeloyl-ACP methyl ester carboxylesterase
MQIREVAADVAELTRSLGIGEFATVGVSGGAPYALACAHELPTRVPVAVVASGLGPLSKSGVLRRLNPLARRFLLLGRRFPALARIALKREVDVFRRHPQAFVARFIRRWSRADQELFARPEVRDMFLGDLTEILIHGEGEVNLVKELRLYFRWGFRLQDLSPRTRVLLSHGREDDLVPTFMSSYAAARIPNAHLTLHPGGHFSVLTVMEPIMRMAR